MLWEKSRAGVADAHQHWQSLTGADEPDIGRHPRLLNLTGDFAATFNLDLAIGNSTRHVPARSNEEPLADREVALELAPHHGFLDRGIPLEIAGFGDLHVAAVVQRRL